MRIVSGQYSGRKLEVPKGRDIRPTSDKVRGAVFNALRSRGAVEDEKVLDAFCGSGALGLEALSQGASSCTFVDKSRHSLELAQRNAKALGLLSPSLQADPTFLRSPRKRGSCTDFEKDPRFRGEDIDLDCRVTNPPRNDEYGIAFILKDATTLEACEGEPYTLLFLDPPYNQDLLTPTLSALAHAGWVAENAFLVCEVEKRWAGSIPDSYTLENEKTYGDTKVMFLRYTNQPE